MITGQLVDHVEDLGTIGTLSVEETGMPGEEKVPARWVPVAAYLAADRAFDAHDSEVMVDETVVDELWMALGEAAPHIRAHELERHLGKINTLQSVSEVVAYLIAQRSLLLHHTIT